MLEATESLTKKPRVVLTGPPCSGKTTLAKQLLLAFPETFHYVPEAGTAMIAVVGVRPPTGNRGAILEFERCLYQAHRVMERLGNIQAWADRRSALLLDMCAWDCVSFLPNGTADAWETFGVRREDEFRRYGLVLNLAPAPPEVFERERHNNPSRVHSCAESLALAPLIAATWSGHPGLVTIDGWNWPAKLADATRIVKAWLSR